MPSVVDTIQLIHLRNTNLEDGALPTQDSQLTVSPLLSTRCRNAPYLRWPGNSGASQNHIKLTTRGPSLADSELDQARLNDVGGEVPLIPAMPSPNSRPVDSQMLFSYVC